MVGHADVDFFLGEVMGLCRIPWSWCVGTLGSFGGCECVGVGRVCCVLCVLASVARSSLEEATYDFTSLEEATYNLVRQCECVGVGGGGRERVVCCVC